MIRKAKVLKKPKFDLTKLMDLYKDSGDSKPKTDAQNAISASK